MRSAPLFVTLAGLSFACAAPELEPTLPACRDGVEISAQRLLAFSACNEVIYGVEGCRDPSNHELGLGQSDDGVNWTEVSLSADELIQGSVPDVIRWNVDGQDILVLAYLTPEGLIGRIYSSETEQWGEPQTFRVTGLPKGRFPVDPSFIVFGEDLYLFAMLGEAGADPAKCPEGSVDGCTKKFISATAYPDSLESGLEFELNPEFEFSLHVGGEDDASETASDPDVFPVPGGFVLLISHHEKTAAWFSEELTGTYTLVTEELTTEGAVASGYYDEEDGRLYIYYQRSAEGWIYVTHSDELDSSDLANQTNLELEQGKPVEIDTMLLDDFVIGSPGNAENCGV